MILRASRSGITYRWGSGNFLLREFVECNIDDQLAVAIQILPHSENGDATIIDSDRF
jgi:hypothetical protein